MVERTTTAPAADPAEQFKELGRILTALAGDLDRRMYANAARIRPGGHE